MPESYSRAIPVVPPCTNVPSTEATEVADVSPAVIDSVAHALSPNHDINTSPADSFTVLVADLPTVALPMSATDPTPAIVPGESMESVVACTESIDSDTHASLHSPRCVLPLHLSLMRVMLIMCNLS
ncbi:hypothetical protein V6N11_009734 [Hibiscus sabdariffa]|uniref:Uncharacterized protein n=1 Tax=Hibiscus sabdariffa TaxID=183260 RepID=A0ABR2P683_9ROSI